jgi:hypothetical protein
MTEPSNPRWELLPHDPEPFFELSGEYDLRDLKRKYNRLIRRFKPEKFPDEFKRIRAAYESLSDALRYNLPTRRVEPSALSGLAEEVAASLARTESDDPTLTESTHVSRAADPAEPLHERIATVSPQDLYAELKAQLQHEQPPTRYFHLAVLSDVVVEPGSAESDNESFLGWILAGIEQHPGDWGLTCLLREYLSQDLSTEEIAELLPRIVQVTPPDRFRYATERAWDFLLRNAPFEVFRGCFEQCAARLDTSVDDSQLIFYLHVLKPALWKADDDWLREIVATLEDYFHQLDSWAQDEYELIVSLVEYRAERDEFIKLGPCCQRIDRAMCDWCLLSESEGDFSVLDCHYFLSTRGHGLLDELTDPEAEFLHVVLPWERIVEDVEDRLGEPLPPTVSELEERTREFMVRVMRRSERTLRYYIGLSLLLTALVIALFALVTCGALAVRMCMKVFAEGAWLSALLDALLAVVALVGGLGGALVMFIKAKRCTAVRYAEMRRELIKLLRVAPLRLYELSRHILAREDEKFGDNDSIDDTDVIVRGMLNDPAMQFFSLAQVSLNAATVDSPIEAEVL